MSKKKILMTVMEAGAGHRVPAQAVKESIEDLYPGKYQIDVIDYAKECGAHKSDKGFKDTWDFALGHPFWAKVGYMTMELFHPLGYFYTPVMAPDWVKKGREYIAEYQPDIVFAPHFFSLSVVAQARKRLKADFKLIGFVTDPFDAYSFWCDPRADILIGASDAARRRMLKHGIPKEKIRIMPFPIKKAFFHLSQNTGQIQKTYGLDPSLPTILTTAGGQGISHIGKYVMKMCKEEYPFNILSVCGRNEELKAELEKLVKSTDSKTNLVPLGYVSNMNELLSVSDVCVAKAGASTTFEALLMGTPIIFTDWATYSEKPNVDYCLENGVGWWAENERQFFKALDHIQEEGVLEQYKANLKGLELRTGADDLARLVVEQLEGAE